MFINELVTPLFMSKEQITAEELNRNMIEEMNGASIVAEGLTKLRIISFENSDFLWNPEQAQDFLEKQNEGSSLFYVLSLGYSSGDSNQFWDKFEQANRYESKKDDILVVPFVGRPLTKYDEEKNVSVSYSVSHFGLIHPVKTQAVRSGLYDSVYIPNNGSVLNQLVDMMYCRTLKEYSYISPGGPSNFEPYFEHKYNTINLATINPPGMTAEIKEATKLMNVNHKLITLDKII